MKARICLNMVTIRSPSLQQKICVAKEAGYEAVGLWLGETQEFLQSGRSLGELRSLLGENGLVAAEICFVGGWQWAVGEERSKALDAAQGAFAMAREVGCDVVIACASGGKGDLVQATEDYGVLCDLAAGYGVCPALEFIGPFEQVKDIATAWEIVKGAGRPNGGILLDTFHFMRGGSRIEDLEALPPGAVAFVHINDAPRRPIEELTDADRALPGEGFFPLQEILSILARKGYEGYLSLELFNRQLWEKDALEVAKAGAESLHRLLAD